MPWGKVRARPLSLPVGRAARKGSRPAQTIGFGISKLSGSWWETANNVAKVRERSYQSPSGKRVASQSSRVLRLG